MATAFDALIVARLSQSFFEHRVSLTHLVAERRQRLAPDFSLGFKSPNIRESWNNDTPSTTAPRKS